MRSARVSVLLLAIIFCLTSSLALAGGDSWVVIKDKNGICKVIKSDHTTPKTVAGPFKTKEEAQKTKEKECAKAESSKPSKTKSPK